MFCIEWIQALDNPWTLLGMSELKMSHIKWRTKFIAFKRVWFNIHQIIGKPFVLLLILERIIYELNTVINCSTRVTDKRLAFLADLTLFVVSVETNSIHIAIIFPRSHVLSCTYHIIPVSYPRGNDERRYAYCSSGRKKREQATRGIRICRQMQACRQALCLHSVTKDMHLLKTMHARHVLDTHVFWIISWIVRISSQLATILHLWETQEADEFAKPNLFSWLDC